jgi:hypothetical protein
MLFELYNALSNFERYINSILKNNLDNFVFFHANDILTYTLGSFKDHREKVSKIL